MGCGCGGGTTAAASATATVYAVQLPDGTKMGRYPTFAHAEVALRTSYKGQGKVVPR